MQVYMIVYSKTHDGQRVMTHQDTYMTQRLAEAAMEGYGYVKGRLGDWEINGGGEESLCIITLRVVIE